LIPDEVSLHKPRPEFDFQVTEAAVGKTFGPHRIANTVSESYCNDTLAA
jgi:hypothetical protein